MKKCSNEKLNKQAEIQIEIHKRFLAFKDDFIKVIKQFDGKVMNQRFLTALEKISPKYNLHGRECSDFRFSFGGNRLTIAFYGLIDGNTDMYYNRYNNTITFYAQNGCKEENLYGKRLNADDFLLCVEAWFDNQEKQIERWTDYVANFDRVAKVYQKAYDMLKEVKDYRCLCEYADCSKEKAMRAMKDVYCFY